MRVIPVIDLLGGTVVHAVKGERQRYRPVKSVLCATHDPRDIAVAFRDRLGLKEVYVADLDAIQSSGQSNHREAIATLSLSDGMDIILDAGVSDAREASAWLEAGVRKIVVGSETLLTWNAIQHIPASIDSERLVFSLDFRGGKILSRCSRLAAMSPMEALKLLQSAGWNEVLMLDLGRVGSRGGADLGLAAAACADFPDLALLIGGGVTGPEELSALAGMGIAGVLVATALHRGTIDAANLFAPGAAG
jgi:phosphoribosylformimino-5-aminoimidazole carboxamide ribotide isomerase